MSQSATAQTAILGRSTAEQRHRKRVAAGWITAAAFVAGFGVYGFDYYTLGLTERPFSPKHALLRPSGTIGINLGLLGVLLFFLIYLYPLRKKIDWLSTLGNPRHWLDFHVILGTAAPIVIALHSSFKFGGIAGLAFWIMLAVTLSGFIGRYLYSQIPRTLSAAELTIQEIQAMEAKLRSDAEERNDKIGAGLTKLLRLPSQDQVAHTPMVIALCWMIWLDLKRPLQVSELRLRAGGFRAWLISLFGILPTRNEELEMAIQMVRKLASLCPGRP